jgi:hypothetical protein
MDSQQGESIILTIPKCFACVCVCKYKRLSDVQRNEDGAGDMGEVMMLAVYRRIDRF